jgi:hypothetical protein
MPRYWSDGDPPRLTAPCERRVAAILAPYDHHRVVVGELWGVLLTADWEHAGAEPPVLVVVFHPAPARALGQDAIRRAIQKHPPAPSGVQSMVDTLVFG